MENKLQYRTAKVWRSSKTWLSSRNSKSFKAIYFFQIKYKSDFFSCLLMCFDSYPIFCWQCLKLFDNKASSKKFNGLFFFFFVKLDPNWVKIKFNSKIWLYFCHDFSFSLRVPTAYLTIYSLLTFFSGVGKGHQIASGGLNYHLLYKWLAVTLKKNKKIFAVSTPNRVAFCIDFSFWRVAAMVWTYIQRLLFAVERFTVCQMLDIAIRKVLFLCVFINNVYFNHVLIFFFGLFRQKSCDSS